MRCTYPHRPRGFTLVELLVALAIMALMVGVSWRALGGMQEAVGHTRAFSDEVATLDAGLAQWGVDLERLAEGPQLSPLDWDGRSLRLTRHAVPDPAQPGAGLLVVAWTLREQAGVLHWMRWQSEPVRTRQAWQAAWDAAALWAQGADAATRQAVAITPVNSWQLFFNRGQAWSNSLSSAGNDANAQAAATVPDGVRLVLMVTAPHPLSGSLTSDWARAGRGQAAQ